MNEEENHDGKKAGIPLVEYGYFDPILWITGLMDSSKVARAADFWSCEKNDLRNCPTINFFMFVNGLMTPGKIIFYESATFDESVRLGVRTHLS